MRQCEKCKLYFEGKISFSSTCYKCTLEEQNKRSMQLISECDSLKEMQMKISTCNSQSTPSSKYSVSSPVSTIMPIKFDFLDLDEIDETFSNPKIRDSFLKSLQAQGLLRNKLSVEDQSILRDAFETFVMSLLTPGMIPNSEQNICSTNTQKSPDIFGGIRQSLDSTRSNRGIFNAHSDCNNPLQQKEQPRLLTESETSKSNLSQLCEATRSLETSTEEFVDDKVFINETTSNSSQNLSSINVLESKSNPKLEYSSYEIDSDDDYIDVYDPRMASGSKLFKCEQCRLRFNYEIHLLVHLESHIFIANPTSRDNFNNGFSTASKIVSQQNFNHPNEFYGDILRRRLEENNLKRKTSDPKAETTPDSSSKRHCGSPVKIPISKI